MQKKHGFAPLGRRRRPGEDRDLRRERRAALPLRPPRGAGADRAGSPSSRPSTSAAGSAAATAATATSSGARLSGADDLPCRPGGNERRRIPPNRMLDAARGIPRMRQIDRTVGSSLSVLMVIVIATGAPAQPSRGIARVGILNSGTAQDARVKTFRDGLRELGYVEGQNLVTRTVGPTGARSSPVLADDLLASHVDVIVAMGPSAGAVKQQTSTRPIVFAFSGDPWAPAWSPISRRPGGNITGLSFMSSDLAAKRLDLLKQMRPRTARVAASTIRPSGQRRRNCETRRPRPGRSA